MSDFRPGATLRSQLRRWIERPAALVQRRDVPAATEDEPSDAAQTGAERVALLMRFESLGENCELGFVQEHLGAHPVGLFRWSGIELPNLIQALETDLAGIGEPDFTTLDVDVSNREFFTSDRRYGMNTHTRMFDHETRAEDATKLLHRRAIRLREKLLEDLAEGEKTFVFQSRHRPDDLQMQRLLAALRRHGRRAELLVLHPSDDAALIGQVERIEPGLMLGRLDRSGFTDGVWRISYQLWLEVLAKAARLRGTEVPDAALTDVAAQGLCLYA